jgi:hypothetical protein
LGIKAEEGDGKISIVPFHVTEASDVSTNAVQRQDSNAQLPTTLPTDITTSSQVGPFFGSEDRFTLLRLATFGGDHSIVLGHNFWVEKIKNAKTTEDVNAVVRLWLGAAQQDIDAGDFDSAKARINEILDALSKRKSDPLLIASTKFRAAHLLLTEKRWAEALTYAKESNDLLRLNLAQINSSTPRQWLDWGGYDELHYEPIIALHVLARAQRMNKGARWQETIEDAITSALKFEGPNGSLYQASLSLKKQLSGEGQK